MGRILYPAGAPAGYPVSGGKIGRIAGNHFSIITYLYKVGGSSPELWGLIFFINFKIFKKIKLNVINFNLLYFNSFYFN